MTSSPRSSQNISAAQIRDDYERRVDEAARQAREEEEQAQDEDYQEEVAEPEPEPESPEQEARKRKREQAIEKLKNSKEFSRRKKNRRLGDENDDELADEMLKEKNQPVPGQLAHCEICGKRFTVTAYSKTGPLGGLLCPDCSKKHTGKDKKDEPKKRGMGINRRQNQSKILDGVVQLGARSLMEMCIKKIAENIDDVEGFGDLPPPVMRRLSQILSRNRAITPVILDLFLKPYARHLDIFDCAKLETKDFHKILATMQSLTRLDLRFVTQMKDDVFEYMIDREMKIQELHLDAPSLVTSACWQKVFASLGPHLKSLKLWNLEAGFDDETFEAVSKNCANLQRLKLKHLGHIGDQTMEAISTLKHLEHLSLHLSQELSPEPLLQIIAQLGSQLGSLSLEEFESADDRLVQHIHDHCRELFKLRISHNALITDKAMAGLFRGWSNPALRFVDFSSLRDVDMDNHAGPEEPVGLASNGFVALMAHSGRDITTLNVSSCRHITHAALEEVFAPDKQYPHLISLDVSLNERIDDFITHSIFRCCPALKKLVVFGCFKIRDIKIPRGVAVIGTVGAKLTSDGVAQQELVLS
ncbi:hypothetical protein N7493_004292 [Penicillium malachiteum]|uniref:DNA repair protein rhp7 treble clef domain-containing protein n=1 Tax=Penicillium malachiteum TaxID=1324776 RepID=A0AAD6HR87_9EURO|nr:hypothetical protein N7493_004292 [Penicillium malachiteum]